MRAASPKHSHRHHCRVCILLFFNTTPPTKIYTLSLHDALPISAAGEHPAGGDPGQEHPVGGAPAAAAGGVGEVGDVDDDVDRHRDRKSTRLNSSHVKISYAVFCLKKKKKQKEKSI